MDLIKLLPEIISLSLQVTQAILPIYLAKEESLLTIKADGSPLAQADLLAHELIKQCLQQKTPDIPIISEESAAISFALRQTWSRYWLIDPIDGTKEFLAKSDDFTINIALIDHHQPILGLIALPATQTIYYAIKGVGVWKQTGQTIRPIRAARLNPNHPVRVIASRRHGEEAADKIQTHYPNIELMRRGSSLKFCLLAEGLADFYPRLGLTSEWDTAAAQCILQQAGGCVIDLQGAPLLYNTKDSLLNPYFLAAADPSISWQNFFMDYHDPR